MKSATVFAVIAIVLSVALLWQSGTAQSQEDQRADSSDRLNELLVLRRDTLGQLVEVVEEQFSIGQSSLEDVILAKNRLLDAELQIAKTPEQRKTILEGRLENLRALEDLTKQLHDVGRATSTAMLSAKAARIAGEIDLLRG